MIVTLFWLFISTVLYTYFGYPALLTLLARTRPKPKPYPQLTPTVTLLIAAYNEEAVIAQKVENSLALDYPAEKLQILVANDGSNDKTAHIVRQYASRGIELNSYSIRQGKIAAINQAMPLARGEIVVLTDAPNFFEPNALRELVAPFADPTVGVVTGAKSILGGDGVLGESEGLYWKYETFILRQETRLGCCSAATGDSMAIRRDLFTPLPYNGIGAIDFHIAMWMVRHGYRIVYAQNVRSYERISPSAKNEIERRARMVAGRYQAMSMAHNLLPFGRPLVVWQIISHKFMRPLVPLAMLGAWLTNVIAVIRPSSAKGKPSWLALLSLAPPINWILLIVQGIFYGLALIGNRREPQGVVGKLLYLPTYLVNSNLAALIGFYRFFTGNQSPLWKRVPRREEIEESRV